jgi:hypothetical protein
MPGVTPRGHSGFQPSCACWEVSQALPDTTALWLRVPAERFSENLRFPPGFHFSKQKECRSEHQRIALMHGSAFLPFLFFPFLSISIFLALRIIKRSDILADGQILPGFTTGGPVFSELRFFLFHQLSILHVQLLYAGDLFDAKFIESFLGCLVNGEFLPVSLEEAIPPKILFNYL